MFFSFLSYHVTTDWTSMVMFCFIAGHVLAKGCLVRTSTERMFYPWLASIHRARKTQASHCRRCFVPFDVRRSVWLSLWTCAGRPRLESLLNPIFPLPFLSDLSASMSSAMRVSNCPQSFVHGSDVCGIFIPFSDVHNSWCNPAGASLSPKLRGNYQQHSYSLTPTSVPHGLESDTACIIVVYSRSDVPPCSWSPISSPYGRCSWPSWAAA